MRAVQKHLSQTLELDKEISQLKLERKTYVDTWIGSLEYQQDKIQKSPTNSQENKMMKYLSIIEAIDEKMDKLTDLRFNISRNLEKITSSKYRQVLRCRYILLMTFEEIALHTCYDIRHVHRLHKDALDVYENIIFSQQ